MELLRNIFWFRIYSYLKLDRQKASFLADQKFKKTFFGPFFKNVILMFLFWLKSWLITFLKAITVKIG